MDNGLDEVEDPLWDLVVRLVRYDPDCLRIVEHKNGRYQDLPLDHIIPLAFYTTSTDLKKIRNASYIAQLAVQQYKADKSDLFIDWQKYCKALDGEPRAMATFVLFSVMFLTKNTCTYWTKFPRNVRALSVILVTSAGAKRLKGHTGRAVTQLEQGRW